MFCPFVKTVFHYLGILLHEFGHAFFFWIFGYPAIPRFDLAHGSGVTTGLARQPVIFWGIHGLLVLALCVCGRSKWKALGWLTVIGLWVLFAHTRLHEVIILYMGHGTELLIAGVFLYRATTGEALEREHERPVYAASAFYLIIDNVLFSIHLMNDSVFRFRYENDPRGIVNDFHDIASFHLSYADVSVVAGFHLFMCLATVVLAAFAIRYVKIHY